MFFSSLFFWKADLLLNLLSTLFTETVFYHQKVKNQKILPNQKLWLFQKGESFFYEIVTRDYHHTYESYFHLEENCGISGLNPNSTENLRPIIGAELEML